jgi:hypothetical protein
MFFNVEYVKLQLFVQSKLFDLLSLSKVMDLVEDMSLHQFSSLGLPFYHKRSKDQLPTNITFYH